MGNACLSGDTPTADIDLKTVNLTGGNTNRSSVGSKQSDAPVSRRKLMSKTKPADAFAPDGVNPSQGGEGVGGAP